MRDVLVNFLLTQSGNKEISIDQMKELSLEHGKVKLKSKRDLAANQFVTVHDVELD